MRGGKLLAFLDPLTVVDSQSSQMNPMQRNRSSGSSLELLLKAWGVTFDTSKVVADMNFVTAISRGARPENMPAVLSLTQEAVDTNDVVTGQIDSLLVPFAGAFAGTPAEGLKQTVLLKTTKNSQLVEKMLAEFSSEEVVKEFAAGGKEMPLAIRLTGKFKTAFPEGKPKDKPGDDPKDKDAAKDEPRRRAVLEGVAEGRRGRAGGGCRHAFRSVFRADPGSLRPADRHPAQRQPDAWSRTWWSSWPATAT